MKTGRPLMEEVLKSTPPQGVMDFWWLGQLGYLVKLADRVLLIDGYLDDSPVRLQPSVIRPDELEHVDYVLGTHDHGDHIDREAWKVIARTSPETKFVVPQALVSSLSDTLGIPASRFIGINEGSQSYEADGLTITGVASAHETLDRDEATGLYPYTGYLIAYNGVRLYHSGDCVVYEGLQTKLKQAGTLDVMFLPINGRDGPRYRSGCIGNMTFQEAVDLTCAVQPKLVVPGHYDMFRGNTANPFDFTDYLEAKAPRQAFWVGARGVRVRYSREDS